MQQSTWTTCGALGDCSRPWACQVGGLSPRLRQMGAPQTLQSLSLPRSSGPTSYPRPTSPPELAQPRRDQPSASKHTLCHLQDVTNKCPEPWLLFLRKVQVHWLRTTSYCLPDVPPPTGNRRPTPAHTHTQAPQEGVEEYQVLLGFISNQRGREDGGQIYLPAHTALVWLSPVAPCVNWL